MGGQSLAMRLAPLYAVLLALDLALFSSAVVTLHGSNYVSSPTWIKATGTDVGSDNHIFSGTVSAACTAGGSTKINCPHNVMDKDDNTVWQCSKGGGTTDGLGNSYSTSCDLVFDMGSSMQFYGVKLISWDNLFKEGKLHYKDGGGVWQPVATVSSPSEYQAGHHNVAQTLFAPQTSQHWKLTNIVGHSGGPPPGIKEILWRNSPPGAGSK